MRMTFGLLPPNARPCAGAPQQINGGKRFDLLESVGKKGEDVGAGRSEMRGAAGQREGGRSLSASFVRLGPSLEMEKSSR